jgi:hypothetical protein
MRCATHELSNQFNRASEATTMKTIQTYIKEQENLLYAVVIQSRNKLELLSNQIESMKTGIQSSEWRKTAA